MYSWNFEAIMLYVSEVLRIGNMYKTSCCLSGCKTKSLKPEEEIGCTAINVQSNYLQECPSYCINRYYILESYLQENKLHITFLV